MTNDNEIIEKWNAVRQLKHEGSLDQAVRLLMEIINTEDELIHRSAACAGVGNIFRRQGRYHDAYAMYNQGLSIWSMCPYSRMGLANLLTSGNGLDGDKETAFNLLKELGDVPVAGVHVMLGLMLLRGTGCQIDLEQARNEFRKGYKYGNLVALRLLAHVLWRQKRYVKAICMEISASARIIPIYLRDKNDPRVKIS